MVESPGLQRKPDSRLISSDYRPALPSELPDSFRDNNWIAGNRNIAQKKSVPKRQLCDFPV
jgi:hypothetical protein